MRSEKKVTINWNRKIIRKKTVGGLKLYRDVNLAEHIVNAIIKDISKRKKK